MTTTPDFRALCAELVDELHHYKIANPQHDTALLDRARHELATPPPKPGKSIEELIAGCKPLDPAMAEMLTPDARWRLFGEDDSLPPPPEMPTQKDLRKMFDENDWNYISPETFEDIARTVLQEWG
jgi:hypothetical protein